MATKKKLFLSAAGAGGGATTDVDDVFSTDTWIGNAGSQIIENGIKLSNTHDGGSARFPGTSGLVIPDHAGFQFGTGNWTIEAWVFPTKDDNFVVCSWGESSGVRWDFGWQSSSNPRILVNTSSSSQTSTASSTPISGYVGQWVHIACVRNGSDIVLYVGGVAKTTMSYTGTSFPNPSTAGVNIGTRFYTGQNNVNNSSFGFISDFRIVKGTAVYTSNFTPSTSYLSSISGTSFLGLSGDTPLVDQSSNTHSISQNSYNSQDVVASEFGHVTGSDGEGGLVWTKQRSSGSNEHHWLLDTARTAQYTLSTNLDAAQINQTNYAATFNSAGYQLYNWASQNDNNETFVGWTFRKKEKFFDIVTWTGNGTENRQIAHNLGSAPGMILVKGYSLVEDWNIYHRSRGNAKYIQLNSTANEYGADTGPGGANLWFSTDPTSTHFTIDDHNRVNKNGDTYVAYLFAHNNGDGDFGPDGDKDIIKCGGYTGNNSTNGPEINLGFEPQWVFIRHVDANGNSSFIHDNMRGILTGSADNSLSPNANNDEQNSADNLELTSTGFKLKRANDSVNGNGNNYIYVAIRRGPLATPTDATKVFAVGERGQNSPPPAYRAGFAPDFFTNRSDVTATTQWYTYDRLRGRVETLFLDAGTDEQAYGGTAYAFDQMQGIGQSTNSDVNNFSWMWKRAPGYFDMVAYTGTGSNTTVTHNLGVVPEMMWIKCRSNTDNWVVYHSGIGATKILQLNNDIADTTTSTRFNDTAPTSSVFTVGTDNEVNGSGRTYMAYLFATVEGVSKVGTYTGDGSEGKVINCGFTNGARFVLIKELSSSHNWFVYDTKRGISSGNDPYLWTNSTAAQNTSTDSIDPHSSGFAVNYANTNSNGDTYVFYAIA